MNDKEELIKHEKREIILRKGYLGDEIIKTIYFGGGTPSLLSSDDVKSLLNCIYNNFDVSKSAEITFESNPEDLNVGYIKELKSSGINRMSIGIQSFNDKILRKLNRRHSVFTAVNAVELCRRVGIDNISADIIYGIPGMTFDMFKNSVSKLIDLKIPHISAYNLTFHEGTKLYELLKKGKLEKVNDEESFEQFSYLVDKLCHEGFIHYELSNFAKIGYYSKHNSSYWLGEKYIGIGPSAHSFDGCSRQWNVSSVNEYITNIRNESISYNKEILSINDRYNEYIITRLRTIWGISLREVNEKYGKVYYHYIKDKLKKYSQSDYLLVNEDTITLSKKGLFISDMILEDFFIV